MPSAFSAEPTAPLGFDRDPSRSRTLPGHYYFDSGIFESEKRKVFHHSWQYVGHVSMLPEPGNYMTRSILDQRVVLLRDRKGEIRAFFNVCQHRAHQLLKGEGRRGTTRCSKIRPSSAWECGWPRNHLRPGSCPAMHASASLVHRSCLLETDSGSVAARCARAVARQEDWENWRRVGSGRSRLQPERRAADPRT